MMSVFTLRGYLWQDSTKLVDLAVAIWPDPVAVGMPFQTVPWAV